MTSIAPKLGGVKLAALLLKFPASVIELERVPATFITPAASKLMGKLVKLALNTGESEMTTTQN
jgi:hypothetical protein